jgi:hypothetical protein
MHLKKWQNRWEWYIRVEGDWFKGGGGQIGPKLVFDQMTAPIPEVMDTTSYIESKQNKLI